MVRYINRIDAIKCRLDFGESENNREVYDVENAIV
jgi:hypothetical protein